MSDRALTVLITNLVLSGRSGTEIVARNLAFALHALGNRPIVYSPHLGPIADELRAAAVLVVAGLDEPVPPIDVIHGHHLPTTVAAMARWPDTPAVFVCHDFVAWHDRPPLFPAVRRYVAVDDTVGSRLLRDGAPASLTSVILNQPDLARFVPGPALPARPRRALAFAKNHGHIDAIARACEARGIGLEVIGHAVGRVVPCPEQALHEVDLVFTSALSALEAMASGRGVIACDGRGLAGWISPQRYEQWRRLNFGLATLQAPLTLDRVLDEIDRYDADEAGIVAGRIRSEGGVAAQARQYSDLYAAALADDSWRGGVETSRTALARYVQEWTASVSPPTGVTDPGDRPAAGPAPELAIERCAPEVCYAFKEPATDRFIRALEGVAPFDGAQRWTVGTVARLAIRLPEGGPWRLELRLVPFLHDRHPRQRLGLEVNERVLADLVLDVGAPGAPVSLVVPIPADRVPADGLLRVRLSLPDAVSPASLGMNSDRRRIGVALIDARLTVWPAGGVDTPDPAGVSLVLPPGPAAPGTPVSETTHEGRQPFTM